MKAGRGFALALAGGAFAVLISFAIRLLFDGVYLPELAAQALFSLAPGSVESQAVENLGSFAKESAFVGASVVNVFLLAAAPYLLTKFGYRPQRRVARIGLLTFFSYAVMLVLGLVFLALAQVASQPPTFGAVALGLIPMSVAFGAIAGLPAWVIAQPIPKAGQGVVCVPESGQKHPFSRKRRLFIKSTVAAAVGTVILYYGVGLLFTKQTPQDSAAEAARIASAKVTPNDQFYRVDVNVLAPSVDTSSWTLNLHGLVNNPTRITYGQLLSMQSVAEYATLECVSNKVGGDLMGTALWKGVRLRDVLSAVGVSSQAEYAVFRCYDGYDVGVPLDRSLMDDTLLAYEMNGEKLPTEHGYPVRAVVPGLYGMMNAKWITEIELVNQTYLGFWQRKGWTNVALYQTGSTILSPGDSPLRDRFPIPSAVTDLMDKPTVIAGVAFAGDRGISKVEVSTDGGANWQTASLQDPLSGNTWVFWNLDWNPPATGAYRLMVRATDNNGETQTAILRNPFPDGASGYQAVDIKVSGP